MCCEELELNEKIDPHPSSHCRSLVVGDRLEQPVGGSRESRNRCCLDRGNGGVLLRCQVSW